jgi:riboflavin synthase
VNLERPLTAGSPFGGHFVQGHVDGVGRVTRIAPEGPNWWLAVRIPGAIERYAAAKGSIAIDGISLTVASLRDGVVEAAIIPFTYANTNLNTLASGNAVNIEADVLAKYVERLSDTVTKRLRESAPSRWTIERLREEGF